jgi:hypothetical protein
MPIFEVPEFIGKVMACFSDLLTRPQQRQLAHYVTGLLAGPPWTVRGIAHRPVGAQPLKGCFKTGVCPLGAQVRRTLGRCENPASSQKTSVEPLLSAPLREALKSAGPGWRSRRDLTTQGRLFLCAASARAACTSAKRSRPCGLAAVRGIRSAPSGGISPAYRSKTRRRELSPRLKSRGPIEMARARAAAMRWLQGSPPGAPKTTADSDAGGQA